MGAAETIAEAIKKLERLRDERGYEEHAGWLVEAFVGEPSPVTNDELFLVLHRAIDAQLAILLEAHGQLSMSFAGMFPSPENYPLELALATAILGES